MNKHASVPRVVPFRSPSTALGSLGSDTAAQVLAAAGDVTLVIDKKGVIEDLAVGGEELTFDQVESWLDRPWIETVTPESRPKVEEMLRDAAANLPPRWRQINQHTAKGETPVRYLAVAASAKGGVIAVGRDLSAVSRMQQRLLRAQRSMEADFARMRQAESRYRLLFQIAAEAVMVVDAQSRRVVEGNPAAQRLAGLDRATLVGRPLAGVLHPESREPAANALAAVQATGRSETLNVRLSNGAEARLTAALFRQEQAAHFMLRLVPADPSVQDAEESARVLDLLDRLPDAFVLADGQLNILAANPAFLDLVMAVNKHQVLGRPVEEFIGRPGVDLKVLISNLKEHGAVREFFTVLRTRFDTQEEVDISAVYTPAGRGHFGFVVRAARERVSAVTHPELGRSAAQLAELVGRVSLKEIVRETTEIIEQLCIEAALKLTSDNRATAAEMLGLSRQSFYSKLHRYGLGNLVPES